MRAGGRGGIVACLCALALLAAGCGGDDGGTRPGVVLGGTLTVYASLPLRGESAEASRDAVRAHRLALEEARHRVGRLRIRYIARDSAAGPAGGWDPDRTSINARTAVRDPTTIAYLGEQDWEATAISLPILNEAGILQVSSTNTYAGFTREEGSATGEPDRFYPSGQRTFARVIPADHVQAAALGTLLAEEECVRVFVVDDARAAGAGIADGVRRAARAQDVALGGRDAMPEAPADARALGERIARTDADCVVLAVSEPPAGAPALLRALAGTRPSMELFASAALADDAVLDDLDPSAAAQLHVVTPTLPLSAYPPAAQRFAQKFRERHGRPADPATLYAYEAMKALLAAVAEAGDLGNDRAEVVKAFFGLQDRPSVLGTYGIDDSGDTTLAVHGANRVQSGRLVFERVVEPPEG